MKSLDRFLESPLVHLNFNGFRATTLELQRQGWSISAHEEMSYERYGKVIQIMIEHSGLCMVSKLETVDLDRVLMPERYSPLLGGISSDKQFGHVSASVCAISINSRSVIMPIARPYDLDFRPGMFTPIDSTPSFKTVDISQIDLRNFGVFKKINDAANIYLPEKTIAEVLKDILAKQKPEQKEIRQRDRRREFTGMLEMETAPNETIRAQLIAV